MPFKIKHKHYTKGETKRRSVVKSLTWRVLATLDTIIISYFLTGSIGVAVSIGVIETVMKTGVYFLHERVWNTIKWGKKEGDLLNINTADTKRRSIVKSLTWTFIGALITITAARILSVEIKTAITIGIIEIFTRMIIYFFHERFWNNVIWGKREFEQLENEK